MKNCTRQSKTAGLQFLGYVTSDILLLLMFKQINFLYLYLYLTLVTVKLCINYFRTIKSIQNIHHHRRNEVLSLISVTKKKKEKQNAIATAHAANDTAQLDVCRISLFRRQLMTFQYILCFLQTNLDINIVMSLQKLVYDQNKGFRGGVNLQTGFDF